MDFNLIIDEDFYRFLKSDPDSCAFASPFGEVYLNLSLIHRTISKLVKEQRLGLEQELRFRELDEVQKLKLTHLIIHPFTDDIYLTKIVKTLDHEILHFLFYNQDDFYEERYRKKGWGEVHHTLIDHIEKDNFYTFDRGPTSEPVDLIRYLEEFL